MALSELNRRRLRNFRRNSRAFWSLLIFSVLFLLSLARFRRTIGQLA